MKFRQTYNSFFVWKMQKSSNLFWVSCRENFLSLGLSGLPDRSLNSEHSGRVVSKGVLSRLGQIYTWGPITSGSYLQSQARMHNGSVLLHFLCLSPFLEVQPSSSSRQAHQVVLFVSPFVTCFDLVMSLSTFSARKNMLCSFVPLQCTPYFPRFLQLTRDSPQNGVLTFGNTWTIFSQHLSKYLTCWSTRRWSTPQQSSGPLSS